MLNQAHPKILIIENQMIIAADISLQFSKLGYDIIGINTRVEDALKTIAINRPDIIIMNASLQHNKNGVESAQFILESFQIPVVFLNSDTDETLLKRVMDVKPIKKMDLSVDVETVLNAMSREGHRSNNKRIVPYNTDLFIRQKEELIKVRISDILIIQAHRNHCYVITNGKKYELNIPLKKIEEQLPEQNFVRVHRSYLVNLEGIKSIQEHGAFINIMEYQIPISRRLRSSVLKKIRRV